MARKTSGYDNSIHNIKYCTSVQHSLIMNSCSDDIQILTTVSSHIYKNTSTEARRHVNEGVWGIVSINYWDSVADPIANSILERLTEEDDIF